MAITVQIQPQSRLQFSKLVIVGGTVFWDLPTLPKMTPQADDTLYQWQDGDKVEFVAQKFYKDPTLWWVIGQRNGIFSFPDGVSPDDRIVIPSLQYVQTLFKTKVSK